MTAVLKNKRKLLAIFLPIVAVLLLSGLLLVRYANRIIKAELERRLGKAFSVERIDLTLSHVQASGVKLRDSSAREIVRIEKLSLRADLFGILRKKYVISSVELEKPYFMIEKDRNGKITGPALPIENKKNKNRSEKSHQSQETTTPVEIRKVTINDGFVDYIDRKTSSPVTIKLRDIQFDTENVHIPLTDVISTYRLSCTTEGRSEKGRIKSEGKINAGRKDAHYTLQVRSFDLTNVKPYLQKHSSANLTKGLLDVDISGGMVSSRIDASGNAVLRDLRFGGGGNQFMGIPLSLVINVLEKNENQIPVAFKIKGNINNPQFSLQEQFMTSMAIGLAEKLGFSIQSLGEALLSTKDSDRKGPVDILELGKGLKNIFK